MRPLRWPSGIRLFAAIAFSLLAAYCAARAWALSTRDGIGPDGGYLVVHSWLVRAGLVPFRDFWWWYTPGILYMQRIYSPLFGETRAGLRGVIWLQHGLTLFLLVWVWRRYWRASLATCAFCSAIFLGSLSPLEGFFYVLEPHLNVFIWLALVLALTGSRGPDASGARSILWAFAAGLVAGWAFWTKQQGLVVGLLAMAIPSLSSGRLAPRSAFWTAAGVFVVPLAFFSLHPDALRPAIGRMGELAEYAAGAGKYVALERWEGLRAWNWLIPLFPLGFVSALVLARRGEEEDRRLGRIAAGFLAAGFLLLLPSFLRPFRHYLLVPLPFALLAIPTFFRALALLPWRLALTAGLIAPLLVFGGLRPPLWSLRRVLQPGYQQPTYFEMEESIGRLVQRYSQGASRICVVPNAPQYYVYAQKPGDKATYQFLPSDEEVRRALAARVPAFIVDRGGADIPRYERLLESEGYRVVEQNPWASAWLPDRNEKGRPQAAPRTSVPAGSYLGP